jgi:GNAT superfamily N-acetyltransferase
METLPTQTALEVFLRGFSATRSFTKPFLARPAGEAVWMLADPPGGKIPTRTPEFIAYGAEPVAVIDAIAAQETSRYTLCVLIDNASELKQTVSIYKALGHRYLGREPLFVLDIDRRVSFDTIPMRRIVSAKDAAAIAKAARSRQILPEHLCEGESPCRLYAAFEGDTPVGWVRSVRTHADCAWVASMFVAPDHRRKGIGRTLLSAMLDDDARFGVRWSVLLASLTGALLYPHLGYREQGTLLLFSPHRPRKSA